MYEGFRADIPPSRQIYYLTVKGAHLVGLREEKNKKTIVNIFVNAKTRTRDNKTLQENKRAFFDIFVK